VSNEAKFQVTSVLFPTLNNQSISTSFTLPVNLATELANVGLDFRHYKIDLVSQTDASVYKTANILNIATNSHTFNSVAFNNDGYKCLVTCDYKPRDADSAGLSIPSATVLSTRTVKPFDNLVSNEAKFQVTSVLFPTLNNQSISTSFTLPLNLATELAAVGLDFRHYQVDLVNQTDQSIHKTLNISNISTSSHTFTSVDYNNNGYKCHVTCDYKPRDADSAGQSIPSATVLSTRIAKPFDNLVSNEVKFQVSSILFPTLNDTSITSSFSLPINLASELSAVGLDFRHYKVDLISQSDLSIHKTYNITNIATNTHMFTNVAYNNNGYKCNVTCDYKPRDAASAAQSISSAVVISSRIVKPFDNVITDDSNFTLLTPSIDSFVNVDLSHNVSVSWLNPPNLTSNMSAKGLSFKHFYLELVDNTNSSVFQSFIQTNINTLTHTFSNVIFNNSGYKFKIRGYFQPLDANSLTANVEAIGNVSEDSRVLIPYNTNLLGETQYDIDSVDFGTFNNNLVNSFSVNWVKPAGLDHSITSAGLLFQKYLVELYVSNNTSIVVDSKNVTSINTLTTTFSNIAFNNLGYKVKVTVVYNSFDSDNSLTDIFSDVIHNNRILIPYAQVVSSDSNYNVSSVAIDSFSNAGSNHSVNVSWIEDITALQTKLTNTGLDFLKYLVELIDADNNSIVKTVDITTITTLNNTFTDVIYNSSGYTCRVTAYYVPKDTISLGLSVQVLSDSVVSSRTLIPYDKVVTDSDINFAVQTVTFDSFDNVALKNSVNVSWTIPAALATNVQNVGLSFKHYFVELIDQDNSSIVSANITSISTLQKTFDTVSYNATGYKFRATAVFKPRDTDDTTVEVASTPLITASRTLILYNKVISTQNFSVTYATNASEQLTVDWDSATNLNGVGLDIKHYIVKLYSAANVNLATQTVTVLTATFDGLILANNPHYAEVSSVYKPRDAIFNSLVEVTGGFYSEILNTVNIYDVTAEVTQFVTLDLVQTTASISTVNVNAIWTLPEYTINNLLLHTIELELRKNGITIVQSETFTDPYTSNLFNNIAYTYGDYFTIKMRLTLKSVSNKYYVGDYQETSIKIFPQIETTDITSHNLAVTLTETTGDINSNVNVAWANQSAYIGNYEFDKYVIVVYNNTDSSEVYNFVETIITNVSYDALNIVNGKSYNYSVTAHYKSFVNESFNVCDPAIVTNSANLDNTVVTNVNFVNLDISLNTDTVAFNINPNGKVINKIQYLAVPNDINSETNYTDASDLTSFKLVVTENVSFSPYGSINHTFTFNNATHGWNGTQGIRLAVINLYSDNTILASELEVLA
jgi:hypothetical protein